MVDNKKILIKDYIQENIGPDYEAKFDIFDAADYGTPQFRKRTIVRIFKKSLSWDNPDKQKHITVRDSIEDLPSLESQQTSSIEWHFAKKHNKSHIDWMKHTPTGQSAFNNIDKYKPKKDGRLIKGFSTTYKRIDWDKPAPTITMGNGGISSQNNVHPGRLQKDGTYSDARVLSILELFRLSGLPDDFNMPKNIPENTIRHVIGEAVPPKLFQAILKKII